MTMTLRTARIVAEAMARAEAIDKLAPAEGVYVFRPVINGVQVAAWALRAGVADVVAPEDMHVTVVYSRTWAALPLDDSIARFAGDALWLSGLGPNHDMPVIEIAEARGLRLRHAEWLAAGASSKFHDYRPHVTLSYTGQPIPYGADEALPSIILGPEEAAELVEDWGSKVGLAKAVMPRRGRFCGDCPAPAGCVRRGCVGAMIGMGKGWQTQPRVPSGPAGGQWTAGGGFGVGLTAPQYGIDDGFAAGPGIPVPKGPLPKATDPDFNDNPQDVAVYVKGELAGEGVGGVPFTRWQPPRTTEGWANVEGQHSGIDNGGPAKVPGKSIGSGVIVFEPDGRVWVVEPTNHYGGYKGTFPKGTMEPGLSLQANAIKEAYEESGLKVEITGVLGDYERTTSVARYYTARRVGGSPVAYGPETQAVRLVPTDELDAHLNMPIDLTITADIKAHVAGGLAKAAVIRRIVGDLRDFGPDDVADIEATIAGIAHVTWDAVAKKAKGWSKQPRAPAGTPIGGQWIAFGTTFGGAGVADGLPQVDFPALLAMNPNKKGPGFEAKFKALNAAIAAKDIDALNAAKPINPGKGHLNFFEQQYNAHLTAGTNAVKASLAAGRKKAATDPGTPSKLSDLTYAGPKPGGSAQGALYTDATGQKWLVKGYKTAEQARQEVAASRLYALAGASAPAMGLIDLEGKHGGAAVGVASKWEDGLAGFDSVNPNHIFEVRNDFAADAWLANWDAVGLNFDNVAITKAGAAMRVDPGGSLNYRATGAEKGAAFGTTVGEWNTMRDPATAPQASHVFQHMGPLELRKSAAKVTAIKDADIHAALESVYGKGNATAAALGTKLIARRDDIAAKANALAPKSIEATAATKATAAPPAADALPAPAAGSLTAAMTGAAPDAAGALAAAKAKLTGDTALFYGKALDSYAAALNSANKAAQEKWEGYTPKSASAQKSPNYAAFKEGIAAIGAAHAAEKAPGASKAPAAASGQMTWEGVSSAASSLTDAQAASIAAAAENLTSPSAKLAAQAVQAGDFESFASMAGMAVDSGATAQLHPAMILAAAKGGAWSAGVEAFLKEPGGAGAKVGAADAAWDAHYAAKARTAGPAAATAAEVKPADVTTFTGAPPPKAPVIASAFYANVQAKVDKIEAAVLAGDAAALAAIPKYAALKPNTAQKTANAYHDAATAYLAGGGKASPEAAAASKAKLAEAAAKAPETRPFDPSQLTPPPDFVNYKGPGVGLSGSAAVNKANTEDVAAIHAVAKTGDLAALKAMTFQPIDKETGKPEGEPIPFAHHPSQHVREYHSQMISQVAEQVAPTPKIAIAAASDLGKAISSTVAKLSVTELANHAEKIGRYAVLGKLTKTPTPADFGVGEFSTLMDKPAARMALYEASMKAFKALPAAQAKSLRDYTGGSFTSMNALIASGGATKGSSAGQAIDALQKTAQPIAAGILLSRRITAWESAEFVKQLRSPSSVGKILAEAAIVSSSFNPHAWHGPTQLRIHTVGGSKGTYVGYKPGGYGETISKNPSEDEIVLSPGTRFLVTKQTPSDQLTAAEKAEGWGGDSTMVIDVVMLPD